MDVEKGLCWRCELKNARKKCSRCNIAEYCGTRCLDRDKIRHQVECDMWNRNKQCYKCKTNTECSLCSSCREIAYCGRECQAKHWSAHKTECKQTRRKVKLMAEGYRFEVKSHKDIQTLNHAPYYFGNTLAVDLLKLGVNEAEPSSEDLAYQLSRDYNILLAGVGDLRNLLLTTSSLPSIFTGNIKFTLNDIDPCVLARDALFLYMIITRNSRPSIATSITNIWYSLQLPDEDFILLMSALDELIQHTANTMKSNTDGHLDIKGSDFQIMKKVWKKWRTMECETFKRNSINLSAQRSGFFTNINDTCSDRVSSYIASISQTPFRASAANYINNGLFLPQWVCKHTLRYDNPTLTGHPEIPIELYSSGLSQQFGFFVYCVAADLWPFCGWDVIQAEKLSQTESIVDLFHTYISSVIRSAVKHFQKGVIFSKLALKNCTDLCNDHDAEPTFDRIMTSNIVDYTSIRELLSSMRPLLSTTNKHAVLVMETVNWRKYFPEAYLSHEVNKGRLDKLSVITKKDIGYCDHEDLLHITKYDYFDNTKRVILYLRSVFLATIDESKMKAEFPFSPNIFKNIEGFQLRDFTKELNKVVPFRYRLNARLCTFQYEVRNLEWKLITTVSADNDHAEV